MPFKLLFWVAAGWIIGGAMIWLFWRHRARYDPRYYGNLSEFGVGTATILLTVVSLVVALDLRELQKTQRQDAALDRVAATLQWWRTQQIREEERLETLAEKRLLASPDGPVLVYKDAEALKGQYECIKYLTDRIELTSHWPNKLLAGSYLAAPKVLGTDPNEDSELKDPQKREQLHKDYEKCTIHIRQLYISDEQIGRRIRSLIGEVLDISDIALAEWGRLEKDPEVIQAREQLKRQAKSNFCPSPSAKNWSNDVYGLFKALAKEAKKGSSSGAYAFADVMLESYPNLSPFLLCVCGPVFEKADEENQTNELCSFVKDREAAATKAAD